MSRVLVAGWFSYEGCGATAGDLLARDLLADWLDSAGYAYDIATVPPFTGGVDVRRADPDAYSHAIFVCGPFEQKRLEAHFLGRFARSCVIGLNLTMIAPLERWDPFDVLLERDSSADANPDMVFASGRHKVPVIGVCLVEPYAGAIDGVANAAIERLVGSREMTVVNIDTRLEANSTGLRTPSEVESLLARMDVVVTTRLHGMVFSLKNGVPVIAIDPEAGGAKILRQARTVGWPIVFTADAVTDTQLKRAFDYCLTERARAQAKECGEQAARRIELTREKLIAALGKPPGAHLKESERIAFGQSFGHDGGLAPLGDSAAASRPRWQTPSKLVRLTQHTVEAAGSGWSRGLRTRLGKFLPGRAKRLLKRIIR